MRYMLVVLLLVSSGVASAGKGKKGRQPVSGRDATPHVVEPATIRWTDVPPGLPEGGKIALLAGDPGQKGDFTVRLKMPAGYEIKPHTHKMTENVTVISGTIEMGHGDGSGGAGTKMSAGDFISLPAGHVHHVRAVSDVVVQINGLGPFDIKYVKASDDPRQQLERGSD